MVVVDMVVVPMHSHRKVVAMVMLVAHHSRASEAAADGVLKHFGKCCVRVQLCRWLTCAEPVRQTVQWHARWSVQVGNGSSVVSRWCHCGLRDGPAEHLQLLCVRVCTAETLAAPCIILWYSALLDSGYDGGYTSSSR